MTKLQQAISAFDARAQFHDRPKLEAIIAAAREEERAKFPALVAAAKELGAAVAAVVGAPSVRKVPSHLERELYAYETRCGAEF